MACASGAASEYFPWLNKASSLLTSPLLGFLAEFDTNFLDKTVVFVGSALASERCWITFVVDEISPVRRLNSSST